MCARVQRRRDLATPPPQAAPTREVQRTPWGTRMRTAERSQNRTRSQITATSIYFVLVVIPIMGAMLVAWQLGSRLFFGAGRADAPAVTTKFGLTLPSRPGTPERQIAGPSVPAVPAAPQSAPAQSAPAHT